MLVLLLSLLIGILPIKAISANVTDITLAQNTPIEPTSITLCNNKKANLSDKTYLSKVDDYSTYFAVKKGVYYLNMSSNNPYKVKYTFYATADKASSTKAKATAIKKGKTAKGLLFAEDSATKSDWHKIVLTKKGNINFNVDSKSSNSLIFEIIPGNSKIRIWGGSFSLYGNSGGKYSLEDMSAGTYYIKVMKRDKKTSGYYSIHVK